MYGENDIASFDSLSDELHASVFEKVLEDFDDATCNIAPLLLVSKRWNVEPAIFVAEE